MELEPVALPDSPDEHAMGLEPVALPDSPGEHAVELEPVASPDLPDRDERGRFVKPHEHPLALEAVGQPTAQPLAATQDRPKRRAGRQEWCTIVFAGSEREGEFRVVALDNRGRRRILARSSSFRVWRSGRVVTAAEQRKPTSFLSSSCWPRVGNQWPPVGVGTTPHSPGLRPLAIDGRALLIVCRHDRLAGGFQAAALTSSGTSTIVAESPFSRASRRHHASLIERDRSHASRDAGSKPSISSGPSRRGAGPRLPACDARRRAHVRRDRSLLSGCRGRHSVV